MRSSGWPLPPPAAPQPSVRGLHHRPRLLQRPVRQPTPACRSTPVPACRTCRPMAAAAEQRRPLQGFPSTPAVAQQRIRGSRRRRRRQRPHHQHPSHVSICSCTRTFICSVMFLSIQLGDSESLLPTAQSWHQHHKGVVDQY